MWKWTNKERRNYFQSIQNEKVIFPCPKKKKKNYIIVLTKLSCILCLRKPQQKNGTQTVSRNKQYLPKNIVFLFRNTRIVIGNNYGFSYPFISVCQLAMMLLASHFSVCCPCSYTYVSIVEPIYPWNYHHHFTQMLVRKYSFPKLKSSEILMYTTINVCFIIS